MCIYIYICMYITVSVIFLMNYFLSILDLLKRFVNCFIHDLENIQNIIFLGAIDSQQISPIVEMTTIVSIVDFFCLSRFNPNSIGQTHEIEIIQ